MTVQETPERHLGRAQPAAAVGTFVYSEMVSSSQGGGSHTLQVGHLAWGWLGGPACWEGAVLGKCLPSMKAWLLKSCIIICTWLRYGAQGGTIYGLYPAMWLLQKSCHLHPAAESRNAYPELGVTGKKINKQWHRRCSCKQNKI